jgi:hypothetical protein
MSLDVYFVITWVIGNKEKTIKTCKEFLELYKGDEYGDINPYMVALLNDIIDKKCMLGDICTWSVIGNNSVLFDDDLIPLVKQLYESNALNPFSHVIFFSQSEIDHVLQITELSSFSGKEIDINHIITDKIRFVRA